MSSEAWKVNGRVTIVMPTYNRAQMLPCAIQSALAQTVVHLCDIVVVDDGSTDDTRRVVQQFGDRIRYVYRENGGLAAARNTGMRACLNEFVAFLDDDDEWEPDKTERQLEVMRRWPEIVLVAGRARARHPDGRTAWHRLPPVAFDLPVDFAPLLFEDNYLSVPMVLVRRAAFEQTGLHAEQLRRRQDYHMWTRLACVGPFVYLDAPVCTYSVALPDGLSDDRLAGMRANLLVRRLLKRELRRRPDCRRAWHRGMALSLAILRDLMYQRGRFAEAARYGLWSMLHRPWGRPRWEWGRCAASLLRAVTGPTAHQA